MGGSSPNSTHATIVMAHGYSAVNEMYLDRYAEAFADAGLNALVFDNRNFGASDGEPRQEIDANRIGVWGSSYSGGHVLVVSAIDRRVKAVVSQGALVDSYQNLRRLVRPDFIAGFQEQFDADRLARYNGEAPAMVLVVDQDPLVPSALPTLDSYQWFTESHKTMAPSWHNEVTLRSVEMLGEYVPASYIEYISPTPTDLAIATYERAREPKRIEILPGGHFDIYTKGFDQSSSLARDWFVKHLAS